MTPRSLILTTSVRVIYPILLVISAWVLIRGHNQPGGGFIGGTIAVAATALWAVAFGAKDALDRMPLGAVRLGAGGAMLALASGLVSAWVGRPFLTHLWHDLDLGVTTVPISTVHVFDLGVYAAVWASLGAICAHAIALDEELDS
jgi:multicomponent Na+:H+ antiporter subunit B